MSSAYTHCTVIPTCKNWPREPKYNSNQLKFNCKQFFWPLPYSFSWLGNAWFLVSSCLSWQIGITVLMCSHCVPVLKYTSHTILLLKNSLFYIFHLRMSHIWYTTNQSANCNFTTFERLFQYCSYKNVQSSGVRSFQLPMSEGQLLCSSNYTATMGTGKKEPPPPIIIKKNEGAMTQSLAQVWHPQKSFPQHSP